MFWNYPDDWFSAWRSSAAARDVPGGAGGPHQELGERIADEVVAALSRDPVLHGCRLEIMIQNGVVILSGDVDSLDGRTAAGQRAWSVPGVLDVANSLTVRGHPVDLDELLG